MQNVAFVGLMRSGKTSIAECLRLFTQGPSLDLSFADALKDECAELLNSTLGPGQAKFTADFFDFDENRPLYRPLLQWYGTEYRRGQQADYWVKRMQQQLQAYGDTISFTCEDARFLNELEMLRDHGFKIIRLNLAVEELYDYLTEKGMTRAQIDAQLSHRSEQEWQQVQPDLVVQSRFGNLPHITREIMAYLTGTVPDAAEIEEYYKLRYPAIYK